MLQAAMDSPASRSFIPDVPANDVADHDDERRYRDRLGPADCVLRCAWRDSGSKTGGRGDDGSGILGNDGTRLAYDVGLTEGGELLAVEPGVAAVQG
jgi:hypothetical protein